MLEVFTGVILPAYVVAGLAAILQRGKSIPVGPLNQISLYLLTPALLFTSIVGQNSPAGTSLRLAAATVVVIVGLLVLCGILSAFAGHDRAMQSAFQLVTAFPNAGNMALPLLLLAFGQKALDMGVIVFLTQALLGQSLGVFVAARGGMAPWRALRQVFRVPTLYVAAAAFAAKRWGIVLPLLIKEPVSLLSQAAIPMMLVVLGLQLSGSFVVERAKTLIAAIFIRLVASGALACGIGALLGLDGVALAVLAVVFSMPSMVIGIVLATEFDVHPRFVANAVIGSTLCSMLTLTGVISLAKYYLGR